LGKILTFLDFPIFSFPVAKSKGPKYRSTNNRSYVNQYNHDTHQENFNKLLPSTAKTDEPINFELGNMIQQKNTNLTEKDNPK
jgi:hypothetical protein